MIRVLVVDDHAIVRQDLHALLTGEPDLEVVGDALDGPSALQAVEFHRPHVVLMEVRLAGPGGMQTARDILRWRPEVAVVLLASREDDADPREALRLGVAGYLMKDCSRTLLLCAIRAAAAGAGVVDRTLLRRKLSGNGDGVSLSPREIEVLRLLARGFGNRDASQALNLAEVTVKKHVQSLVRKLGARDRTHAAVRACQLGLLD